ncbi:hypothetical protein [Methylomonas sp. HYX-M1]|uniref:hypothetical protein n=1 Tax=Methylomonas sp. HYX-M1 TaxID=3139307 RepID=UPI00345C0C92
MLKKRCQYDNVVNNKSLQANNVKRNVVAIKTGGFMGLLDREWYHNAVKERDSKNQQNLNNRVLDHMDLSAYEKPMKRKKTSFIGLLLQLIPYVTTIILIAISLETALKP